MLGPNNTLILLNGRRIANDAFDGAAVDVNSIPLAAIERADILRDGASAIYGANAIGGVINFILRNDFRVVEGSLYATKTDRGGGDTTQHSLTGGHLDLNTQRFNILVSFDKEESDPIKAFSRPFAATAIRPDVGVEPTSGNFIPATIHIFGGINPPAATGCAPSVGSFCLNRGGDCSDVQCRHDFTSVLDIHPPVDRQRAGHQRQLCRSRSANPTPANVVCSINDVVVVQEIVRTYISKYAYQFANGGTALKACNWWCAFATSWIAIHPLPRNDKPSRSATIRVMAIRSSDCVAARSLIHLNRLHS